MNATELMNLVGELEDLHIRCKPITSIIQQRFHQAHYFTLGEVTDAEFPVYKSEWGRIDWHTEQWISQWLDLYAHRTGFLEAPGQLPIYLQRYVQRLEAVGGLYSLRSAIRAPQDWTVLEFTVQDPEAYVRPVSSKMDTFYITTKDPHGLALFKTIPCGSLIESK